MNEAYAQQKLGRCNTRGGVRRNAVTEDKVMNLFLETNPTGILL